MRITIEAKSPQGSVGIRLIEGTLSRFTGQELFVPYGKTKPFDKAQGKPLNTRKAILLLRKIISLAKQNKLKHLALDWRELRAIIDKKVADAKLMETAATAFLMADFEFVQYKETPKDGFPFVETLVIICASKPLGKALARGLAIGEEVNLCRELANTPGKDMTPKLLFSAARKAVAGTKATVRSLGRNEMEKLGMGAVLGVAMGSSEEPQFIVMEYHHRGTSRNGRGNTPKNKPIVLIGKGVTFDTGGLNIKTGGHMYEMHMDMSGAAAVIHAIALAARLGVKANIVGLIPAVENAVSGSSIRPGDILKSLSGKTIEILDTDAEGRVILADGITYAKRYDPAIVVDVATLTGAALVALGTQASAFMVKKPEDVMTCMHLAEDSGDYLWPFPSWEEYEEMTKGTFGDVPNISTFGNSREGGVIAGGMFLKRFYDDLECPWLHIDMAPRMTAAPNEFLAKGAAGAPVRFLLALAERYASKNH